MGGVCCGMHWAHLLTLHICSHGHPVAASLMTYEFEEQVPLAPVAKETEYDHNRPVVQLWTRNNLFRRLKFWTPGGNELEYNSNDPKSICQQLLRHVQLDGVDGKRFWNKYRSDIKTGVNQRRNACQDIMKQNYIGKRNSKSAIAPGMVLTSVACNMQPCTTGVRNMGQRKCHPPKSSLNA